MAAWPTLNEVRALLRLAPDANEDLIIQKALAAAVDYGNRRLNFKYIGDAGSDDLPEMAHEACLLHAARLYRRRDSLDGTIQWGDAGAIRVGRIDPDVEQMYSALGPVVFG